MKPAAAGMQQGLYLAGLRAALQALLHQPGWLPRLALPLDVYRQGAGAASAPWAAPHRVAVLLPRGELPSFGWPAQAARRCCLEAPAWLLQPGSEDGGPPWHGLAGSAGRAADMNLVSGGAGDEAQQLLDWVLAHPATVCLLCDASAAALGLALLYTLVWGAPVLLLDARAAGDARPGAPGIAAQPAMGAAMAGPCDFELAAAAADGIVDARDFESSSPPAWLARGPLPWEPKSPVALGRAVAALVPGGRPPWAAAAVGPAGPGAAWSRALQPWLRTALAGSPAAAAAAPVVPGAPQPQRVAAAVHCFHVDIWPEISRALQSLGVPFDLFVTVSAPVAEQAVPAVRADFPQARVSITPNVGMDVVPFLSLVPQLHNEGYTLVCKLHTKRGDGSLAGMWRRVMLDTLVGSTDSVQKVLQAFEQQPGLDLVGPGALYLSARYLMLANMRNLELLHRQAYGRHLPRSDWGFFAGTMFWARVAPLLPLARALSFTHPGLDTDYRKDGKLEHAAERLFGCVPAAAGGTVGLLYPRGDDLRDCALQLVQGTQGLGRAPIHELMHQFARLPRDLHTLRRSGLFDEAAYLRDGFGGCPPPFDLAAHYLTHGRFVGASPDGVFRPQAYRQAHPEVRTMHLDPFLHYITRGCLEGSALALHEPGVDTAGQAPEELAYRLRVLNRTRLDWSELGSRAREPALVSVVVPVHHQGELARACVASLGATRGDTAFEVILVDNGSDEPTRAVLQDLAARHDWVSVLRNAENFNFALGCNLGFQAARGAVVVFLNSDTTVTEGWLEPLLAGLADESVAAVQPRLLYPDGRNQCAGMVFSRWSAIAYQLYSRLSADDPRSRRRRRLQAVSAACVAMRARDFARAAGFDPVFINGHEDVDLCLRLTRGSGRHCVYEPASTVVHLESQSAGRLRHVTYNRRVFISRWARHDLADDEAHYAADATPVAGWQADAPSHLQHGVAAYRPRLAGSIVAPSEAPDCAAPFRLSGRAGPAAEAATTEARGPDAHPTSSDVPCDVCLAGPALAADAGLQVDAPTAGQRPVLLLLAPAFGADAHDRARLQRLLQALAGLAQPVVVLVLPRWQGGAPVEDGAADAGHVATYFVGLDGTDTGSPALVGPAAGAADVRYPLLARLVSVLQHHEVILVHALGGTVPEVPAAAAACGCALVEGWPPAVDADGPVGASAVVELDRAYACAWAERLDRVHAAGLALASVGQAHRSRGAAALLWPVLARRWAWARITAQGRVCLLDADAAAPGTPRSGAVEARAGTGPAEVTDALNRALLLAGARDVLITQDDPRDDGAATDAPPRPAEPALRRLAALQLAAASRGWAIGRSSGAADAEVDSDADADADAGGAIGGGRLRAGPETVAYASRDMIRRHGLLDPGHGADWVAAVRGALARADAGGHDAIVLQTGG